MAIASDRARCNGTYARSERLYPSAKTILGQGHLPVTIRHTAIVVKTSGQTMVVIAHASVEKHIAIERLKRYASAEEDTI